MTTAEAARRDDLRRALEDRGAKSRLRRRQRPRGFERLGARDIDSLLLEGGACCAAAWDEGLVDFVRLYRHAACSDGRRSVSRRAAVSVNLVDGRVEPLGPDVLMEGCVHRPH
jgi:riboflavin biosynthesis pyrimidine reductase